MSGNSVSLQRHLGTYDEGLPGPLVILIGAMHGNELAGIKAIDLVMKMLQVEHVTKPDFLFKGRLIAFSGNLHAAREGMRFIDRDLNRLWNDEHLKKLRSGKISPTCAEDYELMELSHIIEQEISAYIGNQIVLLDLHTTSAGGGIFVVPAEKDSSRALALGLGAPVVDGLLKHLSNTCLQYFSTNFAKRNLDAVSFESGQHDDPASVYVAIAAIINLLRSVGCVEDHDVESRHDTILKKHSSGLPRYSTLVEKHSILPEDQFLMNSGYHNFQKVAKGEVLASDINGPITAQEDLMILMPLYQSKGNDGYFLIRPDEKKGYFEAV
jgi:succinylglutamate desuccinylase